jgi:hypothetical protein
LRQKIQLQKKKTQKNPESIGLTHESRDPKSWDSSIKKQNKINYKIQSPINLLLENEIKKYISFKKIIISMKNTLRLDRENESLLN